MDAWPVRAGSPHPAEIKAMARRFSAPYLSEPVSSLASWSRNLAVFAVVAVVVSILIVRFGFLEIKPALATFFGALACAGLSMAIGIIFTVSTSVYGFSAPLVGRVSEQIPIRRVIVLGTIAMAAALPFLALFKGVIPVCITLSLINISYAFMLNPASAELGNVVDRSGMSCYSAVYAMYNIFYSVGMLATATLASAAVRLLNFWGVLLCVSAILLLSVPFLIKAGPPRTMLAAASDG